MNVLINDLPIPTLHVICESIEFKDNVMDEPCSDVVYMTEMKKFTQNFTGKL